MAKKKRTNSSSRSLRQGSSASTKSTATGINSELKSLATLGRKINIFETVHTLYPHLSAVISEKSVDQMLNFTALLPPTLSSDQLIFEQIMNDPRKNADLSFLLPAQNFMQISESFNSTSTELKKRKQWGNFINFLNETRRTNLYTTELTRLWLSFDYTRDPSKNWPLDPNIYFGFRSDAHFHLLEGIRSFFAQKHVSSNALSNLKRSYKNCAPLNLHMKFVGFMCARSLDTTRLFVAGQALRDRLEEYLSSMAYPFDIQPLISLLDKVAPYLDNLRLGIDVGESIHDRIGIECYPSNCPAPQKIEIWMKVLSILHLQNLLSKKKKRALEKWIGGMEVTAHNTTAILFRTFSHIKLIFDKSGVVSAKIYLSVSGINKEEHERARRAN